MRIAFLLNRFPLLSETFVLNQITGLIDRGHDVDVYVRADDGEPAKTHADVERYGLRATNLWQDGVPDGRRLPLLARTLAAAARRPALARACLGELRPGRVRDALVRLYPVARLLDGGPYDVVHAHYGLNGLWAVDLRRAGAFRSPVVTTFHDGFDLSVFLARRGRDAYRELFAEGELILAISETLAETLVALGCPRERLAVHPVGVDVGRARPAPLAAPRIVSVARLVEMKGIEYGVRAVARLVDEFPGLRYEIAGDGPLRPELERLSAELGVGERVRLLGWQTRDEVEALLGEGGIFLAPSVTAADGAQEGLPTVLMEAMAWRLPVVATGYSGTPELVRDGVDGRLVPERDVDAIVEGLRGLLRDPAARARMGESGRKRVAERHDIERLNDRLVERYRELLG
jgi:colanic acid/amylovoran biosynthesis glycosyltransferase